MWGIELANPGIELVHPDTATPATDLARAVQHAALSRGLIIEVGGRDDTVLRLLPPLNVTEEEIDAAADILGRAIAAAGDRERPD